MSTLSPEHGLNSTKSIETNNLIVHQPAKMKELGELLTTFENLNQRVSEVGGEDRSGDLGDAGQGAAQSGGVRQISPRDQAIDAIPAPAVIRHQLHEHISQEVKKLRKQARHLGRASRPGSAYRLNELYAKIRRLNALLGDILEASYEVLKRLFIKVFIDRQPVL